MKVDNGNTSFISQKNNTLKLNSQKNTVSSDLPKTTFFEKDKFSFNFPFKTASGTAITNIFFDAPEDSTIKYSEPLKKLIDLGKKYGVPFTEGSDLNKFQTKVVKAIIISKAKDLGIPANVALGMAGHESGWTMWNNLDSKEPLLVQGKNQVIRNKKKILLSTDWGVMQVNDKAHSQVFPKAKQDLEYNIDFGLRFLKDVRSHSKGSLKLGLGDWDKTIAAYNLGHTPTNAGDLAIAKRYVSAVRRMSLKASD